MYQKYASYLLLDFISDDFFIHSVKHPSPKTEAFWLEFLEVFPHQADTFVKAKQALHLLSLSAKQETNWEDYKEIWDNIQTELETKPQRTSLYKSYKPWIRWVAAATVVFMIGVLGWLYYDEKNSAINYNNLVDAAKKHHELEEIINHTSSNVKVNLPDGSMVTLESNSKLSYVKGFRDNKREVFLVGEASFDVIKNPSKPFFVYSNRLITKVLGTSFKIVSIGNDGDVIVVVKSGKVSVYPNVSSNETNTMESKGVVITPNQMVRYVEAKELLQKSLVEEPVTIIPLEQNKDFVFDDTPVKEIFDRLSKVYGIKIVFDEHILAKCTLTTQLQTGNLYDKLNIVCAGINASYDVVDTQIIIHGQGCN
ncbi:FecR family protein [Flectobacillus roseus]|uniref:FecR family protein n=1 Tax=Flectobacillus roseus TaxID=502259 RepID=A0ABT6Y721_9BACT|nr:FecR family protein [Flectobacillus roseus]MDI9859370.1 FecR family protein [Flectobacillus roseus]